MLLLQEELVDRENQRSFTYALGMHEGHLVAEVGDRRLLIDTGAPISIGHRASSWPAGRSP